MQAKRLNRSANIPKSFRGGATFFETPGIGHGIRVAARAFVTFVKERLKCLLLLLLLLSASLYFSKRGAY